MNIDFENCIHMNTFYTVVLEVSLRTSAEHDKQVTAYCCFPPADANHNHVFMNLHYILCIFHLLFNMYI